MSKTQTSTNKVSHASSSSTLTDFPPNTTPKNMRDWEFCCIKKMRIKI